MSFLSLLSFSIMRPGVALYLSVMELLLNNKYSLANMQVPDASQLLKQLSKTRCTRNGSSSYGKTNGVDVFDLVDLSYPKPHAKLLRLKWKKLERLAHKVGGSRNIFMELFGKSGGNDAFWLDTSSSDKVGSLFSSSRNSFWHC